MNILQLNLLLYEIMYFSPIYADKKCSSHFSTSDTSKVPRPVVTYQEASPCGQPAGRRQLITVFHTHPFKMPALLTSSPSSVLPRARWGRNHSPNCTDEKTEAGSGQWLAQDHTAEESRSTLLQVLPTLCSLAALLWTHLGPLQSPFPTVTAATTHQACHSLH